jgi:hypothetical protein
MAIAAVAAFAAFAPAAANADISTVAQTTFGATPTTSPTPSAHDDYTIRQDFTYSALTEDLKKWVVDSPAGLAGNPNAVPFADRCTPTQFDPSGTMSQYVNSSCPSTAKVGDATVYLALDAAFGPYPAGAVVGTLVGDIYILQTDPEIPTTLATRFTSTINDNVICGAIYSTPAPCTVYPKTKSVLAPVTNLSAANNGADDFRVRTVPADYSSRPVTYLQNNGSPTSLHIARIDQHLYGTVNGQPFLNYPSRLDSWDSYSYGYAWDSNTTGTLPMDPNNQSDLFVKSAANQVTPAQTPATLGASVSSQLSTGARDSNPGLTVTVSDPNANNDQHVKKLVTTLPAAVSADVDALNNVCSVVDRDNSACPAASKVGTATIETPFIAAGLTGTVYMTASPNKSLPYLSIFVDGAIKFRLDATTQFVGPNFNQIETTFDQLPQSPFTKFTVNISGGTSNSLLYNRACPVDGTAPATGSTTFAVTGYAGSASSSSSANSFDGCYGIDKPSKISKCVKQSKQLKVTPKGVIAKPDIKNIQLLTGSKSTNMHSRAKDSSSPFSFKLTLKKKKYKKGKTYRYGYRVEYKDGRVIKTKSNTFKTCK